MNINDTLHAPQATLHAHHAQPVSEEKVEACVHCGNLKPSWFWTNSCGCDVFRPPLEDDYFESEGDEPECGDYE